jgi:Tfp pilus assembly protein PilV
MRSAPPKPGLLSGASLVEIMVSIGVLAVVAPLALAAMLQAGEGGSTSRAETRSPLIVENCMQELDMARKGLSQNLPALQPGQEFGSSEVLCLAFAADGKLLGRVEGSGYDRGTDRLGTEDAAFLVRLSGTEDKSRADFPKMLTVKVAIERPAIAPANRRKAMTFYTKLP